MKKEQLAMAHERRERERKGPRCEADGEPEQSRGRVHLGDLF
jgi:hypothetical protein